MNVKITRIVRSRAAGYTLADSFETGLIEWVKDNDPETVADVIESLIHIPEQTIMTIGGGAAQEFQLEFIA